MTTGCDAGIRPAGCDVAFGAAPVRDVGAIAAEAIAALDTGRQNAAFSTRHAAFQLAEAYEVAQAIRRLRDEKMAAQVEQLTKDGHWRPLSSGNDVHGGAGSGATDASSQASP